jgi:anaerobic dimethyl sulfoxide reductase subunit C (anchor subunit)
MPTNEWSLVLFTILMQTSVGLLLASEAARLVTGVPRGALSWQTPTAGGLAAAGLLLSLTHLGTPAHSVFTILNVCSSWLSREILSTGAFFLALVALIALRARTPGQNAWGMSAVAVLLGLAAVAVMSRVYLLVSVPVWDTVATVLSFFGTALLWARLSADCSMHPGRTLGPIGRGLRAVGHLQRRGDCGSGLQFLGIPLGLAAIGTARDPRPCRPVRA